MKRIIAGLMVAIAATFAAGHIEAAGKIDLSNAVIAEWLDNGQNQERFIAWANENLTGEQILSLELLIAPPPTNEAKREALDKARAMLEGAGIRKGAAFDAITDERAAMPDPVTEAVDDAPAPVRGLP